MRCYHLIRPLLHTLPPETAHSLALSALKHGVIRPAGHFLDPRLAQDVFGLHVPNPVGLAAGFDKNAEAIGGLQGQGFGFVELGTVTPLPQEGNPRPRIFRLQQDGAVINRLGFNNAGLVPFVEALAGRPPGGIVGANIGKNKQSEDAVADYLMGLAAVLPHADYVTINVSSPNTQGLRSLQKREQLTQLLTQLLARRDQMIPMLGRRVPLLLKISPDLDVSELEDVAEVALSLNIDGLIVSNTTIKRPRSLRSPLHGEQGGLSGAPLFALSTEILSRTYQLTQGKIPLIGVGGVNSAEDAYRKIRAGASLVQLYTALIYHGFGLVQEILRRLPELLERDGFSHISDAIGADH